MRLHGLVERARQIDVTKNLEIPRLPPAILVCLIKAAGRRCAGVVHQNVDVTARVE